MKINTMKALLLSVGLVAMLATGCSTTSNQGAMGDDTQYGAGTGSGTPPVETGANGSQSASNPLGLGTGTGLTPAR